MTHALVARALPGQEEEDWLEAERDLDDAEQGASKKPEANDFPSPK